MTGVDIKSAALIIFVAYAAALLISLVVDLCLFLLGQPTISQRVWQEPLLGIPVMVPVVGMTISLAVHLFYK